MSDIIGNQNEVSISVIIPIYNASSTLEHCLDSVLTQSYKDLEIICVDDESNDNSVEICQRYCNNDKRVKLIKKENGGVASARNEGLKIARGKYVTFIDQDDWVEKVAYEKMMCLAETHNADMVVCNYTKDTKDYIQKMINRKKIDEVIISKDNLVEYAFYREEYRGFAAFVWNKIFKREVLLKNDIKFDDTLKRGDDVLFFSKVAATIEKTIYIDEYFYHYIQREDSITHTKKKSNLFRLADILVGYEKAIQFLETKGIGTESINYMKCFYVFHASVLLEIALQEEILEEIIKYKKCIERYINEYKAQNIDDEERLLRIDKLLYN